MSNVQSARPCPELAPYVRAYAQRLVAKSDRSCVESVPAQLEQIINFEFGVLPGIRHRERDISREILVGGGQTEFSGSLHLRPDVESFAVFFWPTGWSQLFKIPVREVTNCFEEGESFHGPLIRELWNRMGEQSTFERRVKVVENFLLKQLATALAHSKVTAAASFY